MTYTTVKYAVPEPLPGTDAASAAGCTCAAADNDYGHGSYIGGYLTWRVTVRCPVHDPAPTVPGATWRPRCAECHTEHAEYSLHEGLCARCWAGRAHLAAQEGLG